MVVQRDKSGSEYAIPGGHVKVGETTEEALIREYKEETGADVKCERLL
ncbi:MAG: NUDIX domain-containing protein [Lachnospiraceae bacterium]|nr:NUDIX domain-containing protein [Lachnospiraceae bacterium]